MANRNAYEDNKNKQLYKQTTNFYTSTAQLHETKNRFLNLYHAYSLHTSPVL